MFSFTCPKCGNALLSQYDHKHLEQMACKNCGTNFPNVYYVPGTPAPAKPTRLEHEKEFLKKSVLFKDWSSQA